MTEETDNKVIQIVSTQDKVEEALKENFYLLDTYPGKLSEDHQYNICTGIDTSAMCLLVDSFLAEGWIPAGGPFVFQDQIHQAIWFPKTQELSDD